MAMRHAFLRVRGKRESGGAFDGFLSALPYFYGYRSRIFSGALLRPYPHSDTQGVSEAASPHRDGSLVTFREPRQRRDERCINVRNALLESLSQGAVEFERSRRLSGSAWRWA